MPRPAGTCLAPAGAAVRGILLLVTWQAIPLRAATVIDRPAAEVRRQLLEVDGWRRCATALGYRLTLTDVPATPAAGLPAAGGPATPQRVDLWTAGRRVRIDRIGARQRPVARHRARVDLDDDGVPVFTVTTGPARGGRLALTTQETGAGVLLTAEFANPDPGSGPADRWRRLRQSRYRRGVVDALRMLAGMAVLAAHQTRVVVAAALIRDGAVLAARRSYPPAVAGQWEFPGGKVAPGETDAEALGRELTEELGVDATVLGGQVGPDIGLDVELVLRLYAVTAVGEPVIAGSHDALRWVSAADLDDLGWIDADRRLLPALRLLL